MEEKKIKTKIPSTVVCGVFINIALIILVLILPIDFQQFVESLQANVQSNDVGGGIAVALIGIIVLIYLMCLLSLIALAHYVITPFLIVNIFTAKIKSVKIINIVWLSLLTIIFLCALIKAYLLLGGANV